MSEIELALASFNALKEVATSMINVRDSVKFSGKLGEFNEKMLAAQSSMLAVNEARAALIQAVTGLKDRVAYLEAWGADKQRYELVAIATGSSAYCLKPGLDTVEPEHYICPSCYQKNKKSILQAMTVGMGMSAKRFYSCNDCASKIFY